MIPYKPYLKKYAKENRSNLTWSEAKLWSHLQKRKLLGYKFNRQKPLLNYIVDFYCHKLKLVIELDGPSHEEREAEDKIRQVRLESYGLTFIRFFENDVLASDHWVVREIKKVVRKLEKQIASPNEV